MNYGNIAIITNKPLTNYKLIQVDRKWPLQTDRQGSILPNTAKSSGANTVRSVVTIKANCYHCEVELLAIGSSCNRCCQRDLNSQLITLGVENEQIREMSFKPSP